MTAFLARLLRRKPRTDSAAAEAAFWRQINAELRQGGRGVIAR